MVLFENFSSFFFVLTQLVDLLLIRYKENIYTKRLWFVREPFSVTLGRNFSPRMFLGLRDDISMDTVQTLQVSFESSQKDRDHMPLTKSTLPGR
ncbi:hypothetical protein CEXT_597701 [Caerostris extrusa]|uniref:Uncharacterized protein n=1 Tax=Caerostris extrusa TaxID=172846 RepID=A0AAV4YFM4_CAEEX|nr:hypothetical protein CEXT_597701 [Caerostris extrusa]